MKFSMEWKVGGEGGSGLAQIGAKTALPREFTAHWEFPDDHTVEFDIAVEDGAPVCNEIRVIRNRARPSLTGPELRRLPVSNWIEFACAQAGLRQNDEGAWGPPANDADAGVLIAAVNQARQRRSMTDAHLQDVARVYRANIDSHPRDVVREAFQIQPSTAARWIALARQRGFLGKTTKGKAGEEQ